MSKMFNFDFSKNSGAFDPESEQERIKLLNEALGPRVDKTNIDLPTEEVIKPNITAPKEKLYDGVPASAYVDINKDQEKYVRLGDTSYTVPPAPKAIAEASDESNIKSGALQQLAGVPVPALETNVSYKMEDDKKPIDEPNLGWWEALSMLGAGIAGYNPASASVPFDKMRERIRYAREQPDRDRRAKAEELAYNIASQKADMDSVKFSLDKKKHLLDMDIIEREQDPESLESELARAIVGKMLPDVDMSKFTAYQINKMLPSINATYSKQIPMLQLGYKMMQDQLSNVLQGQKMDAEARRDQRDYELDLKKLDAMITNQGVQQRINRERLDLEKEEKEDKKAEKDEKERLQREGAVNQATLATQDIGRALQILNESDWAAGEFAGLSSGIPGTPAYKLNKQLEPIRGMISVDRLQAMRNASPTGGALGAVSDKENVMLSNLFGSLDIAQDKKKVEENLKRIHNKFNDIIHGEGNGPARFPLSFDDQGRPTKKASDDASAKRKARLEQIKKEKEALLQKMRGQ